MRSNYSILISKYSAILTICLSYPELVDALHETSYGWHLRSGKIENWILTSFQIGRSSIPCHASYYFNTPIPCLRICLEILTKICNIFRVIDMTKHTWKPHSWNVIQRSRSRDETQGHVIPATSMGPVGKFMLRWKNACAKSICCGRRYKLLWVALLHNMRWCISVAHYDSQYIAEWYLRKLGIWLFRHECMVSVDIFGFDVPSKIFGWYTDACGSVDRRLDTRNYWITK